MKILAQILLVISVVFAMTSCSDYSQIIKGDDYEAKLLKANVLYEDEKYAKCLTLYEQIYQRYPRTDRGEVAYYRLAKSYYALNDYYLAGYYFDNFTKRFSQSVKAEECQFMTAICSVKNSPEYSLDQQETVLALNDLQLFVDRYPGSNLVDSCNNTMDRLRYKLELKDLESVRLYSKMSKYKAAAATAVTFIENYPNSKHREEVAMIELENSFELAINSISRLKKERLDKVLVIHNEFVAKYPESDNLNKANSFLRKTQNELVRVDERELFGELTVAYSRARSEETIKKMSYLENVLEKHRIFVAAFPESVNVKKADEMRDYAEKEILNLKEN